MIRCIDSTTDKSGASPRQIHPFSTTSKSTPMNRQFPPEIIQLIVEASLHRYDLFDHYHNNPNPRYAILKSYSLLNSTWHGASLAELV